MCHSFASDASKVVLPDEFCPLRRLGVATLEKAVTQREPGEQPVMALSLFHVGGLPASGAAGILNLLEVFVSCGHVTKDAKLGGLQQEGFVISKSGGQESNSKVWLPPKSLGRGLPGLTQLPVAQLTWLVAASLQTLPPWSPGSSCVCLCLSSVCL